MHSRSRSRAWDATTAIEALAAADLALWTGNAGGLELLLDGRSVGLAGAPGAVVKDLPLAPDALRQRWGADLPAAIMTGDTEDAELRQTRTDTLRVLYKPLRPAELRQVLVQLWRAEGSEHPTKEPAP